MSRKEIIIIKEKTLNALQSFSFLIFFEVVIVSVHKNVSLCILQNKYYVYIAQYIYKKRLEYLAQKIQPWMYTFSNTTTRNDRYKIILFWLDAF